MKLKLSEIQEPVNQELIAFQGYFKNVLTTDNSLLNIVLNYIVKHKGKQLRPLLVFLSAKICGEITEKTYVAASLIELLHTATLVHDDVVDNSQLRRGVFSIKALWKSKLAVLVGDFLLAKGLLISVENNAYDILKITSKAVEQMAEGEILQLQKARKLNIDIDEYYKIIEMKTASLITAATKAGVSSVTQDEERIKLFSEIGKNIGLAFQIKDDLFDYQGTSAIGKPVGNDIQESKMTLPVIYSLMQNKHDKKKILRILNKKKKTHKEIEVVKNFVLRSGGVDFAEEQMKKFSDKAKYLIFNNFEETQIRKAYLDLIDFVLYRKK
jgi:octaprenyl-diphosphate synthase